MRSEVPIYVILLCLRQLQSDPQIYLPLLQIKSNTIQLQLIRLQFSTFLQQHILQFPNFTKYFQNFITRYLIIFATNWTLHISLSTRLQLQDTRWAASVTCILTNYLQDWVFFAKIVFAIFPTTLYDLVLYEITFHHNYINKQQQLMICDFLTNNSPKKSYLIVPLILSLIFICTSIKTPTFTIDLDKSPQLRYNRQISIMIMGLRMTHKMYQIVAKIMNERQKLYKEDYWINWIGEQRYRQIKSIADILGITFADVYTYNMLYELNNQLKMCTSITVSVFDKSNEIKQSFIGKNLDYKMGKFLKGTLNHFKYIQNGKIVYQTLESVGIIGPHAFLKFKTKENDFQYAVSLNQRKGSTSTFLDNILEKNCTIYPLLFREILQHQFYSLQELTKYIQKSNACTPIYFIINTQKGESILIEKDSGTTITSIVHPQKPYKVNQSDTLKFIVQTNYDRQDDDLDLRRTVAEKRIQKLVQNAKELTKDKLVDILTQYPNFNHMTLSTAIIDVKRGTLETETWYEQPQNANVPEKNRQKIVKDMKKKFKSNSDIVKLINKNLEEFKELN